MPATAETIADKLNEWARTELLNQSDLTRNTDAYNLVRQKVADLTSRSWTQAAVPTESKRSEPKG